METLLADGKDFIGTEFDDSISYDGKRFISTLVLKFTFTYKPVVINISEDDEFGEDAEMEGFIEKFRINKETIESNILRLLENLYSRVYNYFYYISFLYEDENGYIFYFNFKKSITRNRRTLKKEIDYFVDLLYDLGCRNITKQPFDYQPPLLLEDLI